MKAFQQPRDVYLGPSFNGGLDVVLHPVLVTHYVTP